MRRDRKRRRVPWDPLTQDESQEGRPGLHLRHRILSTIRVLQLQIHAEHRDRYHGRGDEGRGISRCVGEHLPQLLRVGKNVSIGGFCVCFRFVMFSFRLYVKFFDRGRWWE